MRVGYSVLLSQLVVTVITSLPSSLPRFLYSLRRRRPRGTRVRGEKVTKEPTRRVTEGPRSVTRVRPRGTRGATTGAYDHRTRRTVTKGTGVTGMRFISHLLRLSEPEPEGKVRR